MNKAPDLLEADQENDLSLKEYLETEGYFNVRILEDGVIANLTMLFTTALVVNINWTGYEKRYCYEDRATAEIACRSMRSIDDEPLPLYAAVKP